MVNLPPKKICAEQCFHGSLGVITETIGSLAVQMLPNQKQRVFQTRNATGRGQHSRDSANPKIANLLKHDFEFLVGSYQLSKGFTCVRHPHSDFNIDTNPMITTLERSSF